MRFILTDNITKEIALVLIVLYFLLGIIPPCSCHGNSGTVTTMAEEKKEAKSMHYQYFSFMPVIMETGAIISKSLAFLGT